MAVFFYSGDCGSGQSGESNPERVLKFRADVMLTFWDHRKKPSGRFKAMVRARKAEMADRPKKESPR